MNKGRRSTERKQSKSPDREYRTLTIDSKRSILPEIRNHSSLADRNKDFNKYYISPALRYKAKISNPKEDPENYGDETYIYRNLHNYQFWNWVHPLADYRLKPNSNQLASRVSNDVLSKFKQYVEQRANKRVPGIVKELLKQQE
jgi:hypothetical protein